MAIYEQQLIADLQKGQNESFAPLYDEHFQNIYNHIFYKTLDQNLTEDVVSETFFKAFDKIDQFVYRSEGSFRSWLYTIANNLLKDSYKKKSADQFDEYFVPEDERDFTDEEHNRYLSEAILAELDQLNDAQKNVIIMRLREWLSYEEIEDLTWRKSTSLRKDFSTWIQQLREISQHLGVSIVLVLVVLLWQL